MHLRNHTLMSYRGKTNWPPEWKERYTPTIRMRGEFGVLVHAVRAPRLKNAIHLYIAYEGDSYITTLRFDDASFHELITDFLKQHIGERIEDIASLNIPKRRAKKAKSPRKKQIPNSRS